MKQTVNKMKRQFKYIILPAIITGMLLLASTTAFAAEEVMTETTDQVSVSIPVEQHFQTNSQNPKKLKQTWTYRLTARENAPLPDGSNNGVYTFTLTGNEKKQVGPIIYSHAGLYHYRLALCKGPKNDTKYTVDQKVYDITVSVENSGNGLTAKVIVENMCGQKVDTISFEHLYTVVKCVPATKLTKTIKAKQVKTGDNIQVGLFIAAGLLSILTISTLGVWKRKTCQS